MLVSPSVSMSSVSGAAIDDFIDSSIESASTGPPSARKNLITSSILRCRDSFNSPWGGSQPHLLGPNSAIESFNAFRTLTEGLASTQEDVER